MTVLAPHIRGTTFTRSFTLSGAWTGATFTEDVWFTLRTSYPASSVTDDTDALYQASVSGGEITFSGAVGTVVIPATETTTWPTGKLYFDIKGKITSGAVIEPIDRGEITIYPDITRRTS